MSLETLQTLDSVIDCQALLTRCLNKIDFAERMLTLFQGHCAGELSELDQALDEGDFEVVRRVAHRVAGASANAAAFGLRERATELRRAADKHSLDNAAKCLEELHQEWNKFQAAMSVDYALSLTKP